MHKSRGVGLVIIIAALLTIGGVAYALVTGGIAILSLRQRATDRDIVERFSSGSYDEVISIAETMLQERPMDGMALVFGGFAQFYEGVSQATVEDRSEKIDRSIALLRRAKLMSTTPLAAQVDYILGKAYYHKGPFFADLSVQYLEQALALGYEADDTYEYLGLAYARLGNLRRSVGHFVTAVERHPSDLLYLTIAETYEQLGEHDDAADYLRRAVATSEDEYMRYTARVSLATVLTESGEYDAASELLQEIIEENPGSADAHYYLGVVYDRTGNPDRARFEWREARRIDPNHVEALLSLGTN